MQLRPYVVRLGTLSAIGPYIKIDVSHTGRRTFSISVSRDFTRILAGGEIFWGRSYPVVVTDGTLPAGVTLEAILRASYDMYR